MLSEGGPAGVASTYSSAGLTWALVGTEPFPASSVRTTTEASRLPKVVGTGPTNPVSLSLVRRIAQARIPHQRDQMGVNSRCRCMEGMGHGACPRGLPAGVVVAAPAPRSPTTRWNLVGVRAIAPETPSVASATCAQLHEVKAGTTVELDRWIDRGW